MSMPGLNTRPPPHPRSGARPPLEDAARTLLYVQRTRNLACREHEGCPSEARGQPYLLTRVQARDLLEDAALAVVVVDGAGARLRQCEGGKQGGGGCRVKRRYPDACLASSRRC